MAKKLITAIAAAAVIAFAPLLTAPGASTAPCPNNGDTMPQACMDCVAAAGHDMNALAARSGAAMKIGSDDEGRDLC